MKNRFQGAYPKEDDSEDPHQKEQMLRRERVSKRASDGNISKNSSARREIHRKLTESIHIRSHLNKLAAGEYLGNEYLRKGGTVQSTQVQSSGKSDDPFQKSIFLKVRGHVKRVDVIR